MHLYEAKLMIGFSSQLCIQGKTEIDTLARKQYGQMTNYTLYCSLQAQVT